MIYPQVCDLCHHEFEVIKSYKDIERPEPCPECKAPETTRVIARSQSFSGESDWDSCHYSYALGKVVRNNAELKKEAKRRGLTEVGNEPVDKINKK